MNAKQNIQVLQIIKGSELNLQVSSEICNEQSFMFPAFQQGIQAVVEIVKQTKNFHAAAFSSSTALFQYGGNIISFSAPRGGGKTRMMLSFSHVLSKIGQKQSYCHSQDDILKSFTSYDAEMLKDCYFLSTDPISPSILEDGQTILSVILSRMYQLAERKFQNNAPYQQIAETERIKLYTAFNNCLRGIKGIKAKTGDSDEDFSALQNISDGLTLKAHFHTLIQTLLNLHAPLKADASRFLLLQIDDADSQPSMSYRALEDIRKYLLLPNLVILMSADTSFIHHTILNDHLNQMEAVCGHDDQIPTELAKLTRKYIDKLIPPSQMITLPSISDAIKRNPKSLYLKYLNSEEEPAFSWHGKGDILETNWNLQRTFFELIYRKTGLALIAPEDHMHYLIPRSFRGLNQLLYILGQMDDIPRVTQNGGDLAEQVYHETTVAVPQLERFIDYFVNSWIPVKITNAEDLHFLQTFWKSDYMGRIVLGLSYLNKRFKEEKLTIPDGLNDKCTRYALEQELTDLSNLTRPEEDRLLLFSIRTLMMLESHRLILQQKLDTINEKNCKSDALFFSYALNKMQLPPVIASYGARNDGNFNFAYEGRITEQDWNDNILVEESLGDDYRSRVEIICASVNEHEHYFSILNLLLLILADDKYAMELSNGLPYEAYKLQESALLLAANWELVQALITNAPGDTVKVVEDGSEAILNTVVKCMKKVKEKLAEWTTNSRVADLPNFTNVVGMLFEEPGKTLAIKYLPRKFDFIKVPPKVNADSDGRGPTKASTNAENNSGSVTNEDDSSDSPRSLDYPTASQEHN
ncbi:MAG: hypothetical protein IJ418_15970 [Clostridia bacterium]|nr:hypothetical protein [Clostridia bacterium]